MARAVAVQRFLRSLLRSKPLLFRNCQRTTVRVAQGRSAAATQRKGPAADFTDRLGPGWGLPTLAGSVLPAEIFGREAAWPRDPTIVSDCQLIGNDKAVLADVSDAVAPPRCGAFANSPVESLPRS
jgi:hypothetical protein